MKDLLITSLVSTAVGILLASAFWSGRKPPVPTVEYKDKIVDRIIEKRDTITKIVQAPDGSKVTTVVDKTVTQDDHTIDHKAVVKPAALPDYSLRLSAVLHPDRPLERDYEIGVGRRLFGPVWIEAAVNTDKDISLGAIINF